MPFSSIVTTLKITAAYGRLISFVGNKIYDSYCVLLFINLHQYIFIPVNLIKCNERSKNCSKVS